MLRRASSQWRFLEKMSPWTWFRAFKKSVMAKQIFPLLKQSQSKNLTNGIASSCLLVMTISRKYGPLSEMIQDLLNSRCAVLPRLAAEWLSSFPWWKEAKIKAWNCCRIKSLKLCFGSTSTRWRIGRCALPWVVVGLKVWGWSFERFLLPPFPRPDDREAIAKEVCTVGYCARLPEMIRGF